jgi:hypothetical protein
MKKDLLYLFLILIIIWAHPLQGQSLILNSSVTGVCYAGNKVNRIYIPPPDQFFSKSGTKGGGSIITYYSGFSTQAKNAMEYATSILRTMLPADTKFTILASWEKISNSSILGSSVITGYAPGLGIDAQNPMAFYPVALAEKIAGQSLNDDLQGDLILRINSSINWYLGTDGNTPVQQYDLVTVVLHEICHGLGFFDSMSADGTLGSYGIPAIFMTNDTVTIPMIYDTFIENKTGLRLTDTLSFSNPSADLKSELTGSQLWFNAPILNKNLSGSRIKLYAPSVWDAGSSVSHLDEIATPKADALMTPFIDFGEAIHNPGKITFAMLADLGWINTRILHTPLRDTEQHLTHVEISAQVKSDTLYNRNRVGVVYSFNNFHSSDTLFMTSPKSDNFFKTTITIPSFNSDLQYYLFAEDCFLRLYRSPSLFNVFRYKTYIGTDTVKPVITHTPIKYYLESVDTVRFNAQANDNLGIDSVYIEYKVNSGNSKYIGLRAGKNGSFSAVLNARLLALKGGDSLRYRIFAVDSAKVANKAVLPKNGYFIIPIEDLGPVVVSYATDFAHAAPDFFNIGFSILKPNGFSKYGLHTRHPYESPEENNASIEYTAMLRCLFKFDDSGLLINFNEVVLVEPGAPGSVFGSADFYDYVIVEGSKNFGKSWFKLSDGYDSRWASSWETAYNSSVVGDNSTFTGTESMLRKHTIYCRPSDIISAGDSLLIRFRLYSDPFANGWGWVIEDLKINPLIDALEDVKSDQIKVYPNPGKGVVKLSTDQAGYINSKPFKYSVFNSAGICIINNQVSGDSDTLVDISGYPPGMYIIILYRDDGIKTIKYSLIK